MFLIHCLCGQRRRAPLPMGHVQSWNIIPTGIQEYSKHHHARSRADPERQTFTKRACALQRRANTYAEFLWPLGPWLHPSQGVFRYPCIPFIRDGRPWYEAWRRHCCDGSFPHPLSGDWFMIFNVFLIADSVNFILGGYGARFWNTSNQLDPARKLDRDHWFSPGKVMAAPRTK